MRKLGVLGIVALLQAAVVGGVKGAQIQAVQVGSGFSSPTFATGAPGDTTHLYITEKGSGGSASIKVLDLNSHTFTNFLTITGVATDSEEGLLGLAFDPDFATNKTFYVNYVALGGTAGISKIAEYQAISPTQANPTAVGTLLQFDQPQANHDGGWIGFSPRAGDDHNLYIATGDGGNAFDQGPGHIEPGGNAQSTQTLLGKMLRIHVDPTNATYTIPANNPFAGSADPSVKKEIFTYGLRNPFRDSFDRVTGTLYIGDVGQDTREELDVQQATNPGGGENYGWRLREGNIATPGGSPPVGGAKPPGAIDPILDYDHAIGVTTLAGETIIGGYVYRGSAIPDLVGTYIFGDYEGAGSGPTEVFSLVYDGTNVSAVTDLTSMVNPNGLITNISSFGEDTLGNLYIVDIGSGKIFRVIAKDSFIWAGNTNNNWTTLATDLNWTAAATASWSNNANRATPHSAIFEIANSGPITVNGNIDVGRITFTTGGWILNSGTGVLAYGATGTMTITTVTGTDAINAIIADGSTFGTGGGATSLTKTGPGTLALGGANTYTGGTTVNAGVLLANNSSGSATGTGNVIMNGGTLGGSGSIAGSVLPGSGAYTIHPGEGLAAGSAATLTLGGLSSNSSTTLGFNLVTPGTSSVNDVINVSAANGLTLSGGTVAFTNHTTGAAALGYYKIMHYSGSIQGAGISSLTMPATVNNVAYILYTDHDAGFIDVHRGLLGDANDDGLVDFADFVLLSNNFTASGAGWGGADFDNDGVTDFADFVILSNNFGGTIGSNEAATAGVASGVPEPTSVVFLGVGLLAVMGCQRMRPSGRSQIRRDVAVRLPVCLSNPAAA